MSQEWTHIPIMAREIADILLTNPEGVYVDGTLGLGGHAKYFLSRLGPQARILGFDKDEEALKMARERVNDPRLSVFHASYTEAPARLAELNLPGADGALFDLGLSSYQLDNPQRGFSIMNNGPLDMRFDRQNPLSAAVIVNTWPMAELERILKEYGEERNFTKIALAVMQARRQGPIETTGKLKEIIESVYGKRGGKTHPATQTFQALRIEVNGELTVLRRGLDAAIRWLNPGGRIAVISYHSLEDRAVKEAFAEHSKKCTCPPGFPVCGCGANPALKVITRKPILPTEAEIEVNPRARSAKLRVAEKIR